MLRSALTPEQVARFDERGEIDFAWTVPGLGRFRVNVYRQLRGMDGVFRALPARVPTLDELGLPTALAKFTNYHQGLVLVTGPANCGKSSTLAALVDLINEERREHILTVEDPIEVLHPPKRCVVNQRDGRAPHRLLRARAARGAARGPGRDRDRRAARPRDDLARAHRRGDRPPRASRTLHTSGAIRTMNRIVGVFPADQQEQVRSMVSESLRAVVSQRLVPTADGKRRVPALEMLVNNKAIGEPDPREQDLPDPVHAPDGRRAGHVPARRLAGAAGEGEAWSRRKRRCATAKTRGGSREWPSSTTCCGTSRSRAARTCTSPPAWSRACACAASSSRCRAGPPLDDSAAARAARSRSPSERHWREWLETHDVDFAYGLEGVARFRANYFVQEHGAGAVFRMIPEQIVPLDALALPPAIAKLAELRAGPRARHGARPARASPPRSRR